MLYFIVTVTIELLSKYTFTSQIIDATHELRKTIIQETSLLIIFFVGLKSKVSQVIFYAYQIVSRKANNSIIIDCLLFIDEEMILSTRKASVI